VLAAMRRGDAAEAEQLKRQNLRSAKETLMRFRSYVL
jgi:DNA-binding GntR family transcriptional regulator